MVWKRGQNHYLNRSQNKKAYKLLPFSFLGFEIGASQLSIRFCIRKSNSCGTKKSSQTWKSGLKFFWNDLWDLYPQNWKMLEPIFFYRKLTGIAWMKQVLSNFNSRPLTCDPALFPGKNSLNIEKSNRIFPGKGRGHKAFILTYLDSPTVEVLMPCLFFDLGYLQGETVGES